MVLELLLPLLEVREVALPRTGVDRSASIEAGREMGNMGGDSFGCTATAFGEGLKAGDLLGE